MIVQCPFSLVKTVVTAKRILLTSSRRCIRGRAHYQLVFHRELCYGGLQDELGRGLCDVSLLWYVLFPGTIESIALTAFFILVMIVRNFVSRVASVASILISISGPLLVVLRWPKGNGIPTPVCKRRRGPRRACRSSRGTVE